MSKRKGLFGRQPDMLLVDERPPGISLPSLDAAPLPRLEEEEAEDDVVSFTDEEDPAEEDSYDGGGPLRIFIGSPKKEEAEQDAPAPDLAALAPGPVWDASALAAGDDEDEDDAGSDEDDHASRGPILVKPGQERPEPPPLTMSFGGSFTRGSLDAGVMDDEGTFEDEAGRQDTVVVHDQIYDRFVSLDGAAEDGDSPPARDPDSDDEVLAAVSADDEDEPLGALPAMDEEDDLELPSVEQGPPPTRVLRVGLRDEEEEEDELRDEDELDEDELFASAHVSVAGAAVAPSPVEDPGEADLSEDDGSGSEGTEDTPSRIGALLGFEDAGPTLPAAPAPDVPATAAPATAAPAPSVPQPAGSEPTAPQAALDGAAGSGAHDAPPSGPTTEIGDAVARPADEDWAERRRQAQAASAAFPTVDGPDATAEEDGGGMGLAIFVVIALVALAALGMIFLGGGGQDGASTPTDAAPTMQAPAPTPPPAPAQDAPTPDDTPSAADGAPADAAAEGEPEATPAEDTPAVGADAMPAEGTIDAALAAPEEPTGVLRIRASRTARVYVDDEFIGETPMPAVDLPGGEHEVRVVAIDSGRTRTQEVRVDVGRSQEVRFSF